jgi:hypothetical protein
MALFKSKHAFLTVHVNGKKVNFYQGVANVDDSDKEIIELLENNPNIERVDEPAKEKPKAEEEKPKAKSTKGKSKATKVEK